MQLLLVVVLSFFSAMKVTRAHFNSMHSLNACDNVNDLITVLIIFRYANGFWFNGFRFRRAHHFTKQNKVSSFLVDSSNSCKQHVCHHTDDA